MTDGGIECFLAVCRYKTVSKAAEMLFITQSSLSTKLKNLETELGGILFHRRRGSREMTLTTAGQRFYELALQHEELHRKMLRVCKNQRQVLRVSSLNSLGTYLLPEVYGRFIEQHPAVELQIQDMEVESASRSLLSGNTDIAFISGKTDSPQLVQTPVFREAMAVICKNTLPVEAVDFAHLKNYQELYIEWSNSFAKWHQKTIGTDHSQLTISIMAHLRQFMSQKDCWAIVPMSVAVGLQKDIPIRILHSEEPLPFRDISMLTTEATPTMDSFTQCLRDTLTAHPEITALI